MRISLSVLLCLIFVQDYSGEPRVPLPLGNSVRAVPVHPWPDDPARRQVGALTFLDGIELRERGRAIGGYSALSVRAPRITLLSDRGTVLAFDWTGGARIARVRYSALGEGPGRGWSKLDRDSESLTRDPVTGASWVGFERVNEIWRYSPDLSRATGHVRPPAMSGWEENGGPETLVRLADGRFLTIAETRANAKRGQRFVLIFSGDPVAPGTRTFGFTYRPPSGTQPVDAAELPDGRIVVLNRGVGLPHGFYTVVTMIPRGAIRPGADIKGREIARLAAPAIHDNFEGVAATQEAGRTILWLISDDNQFFVQRTLLLKFRLDG
ncbi:hypothetical protein COC42_02305 [Sphingomonas spermidinifaciens]|uniref:Phytase-like domain-containing protein n=1 Tax=Sphingomonas spermidinifaciens TaxID=1141889 RepID=A0A2A4B245_9SPHN|nr:esterase-like activity of phytase family protein [Sphingomonas spermidinifaciens]PCD03263.1 hypothetical protein COC42_02305 [Sphingomonas spermidinifaciens]